MRRAALALATALLVVTAGCAATPGSDTPSVGGADETGGTGDGTGDGAADGGADDASSDAGTVNFYVSDEPNDMDDFAHLNVTITSVQFHLVDAADSGSADGTSDESTGTPANETDANGTATPVETDENGTDIDEETEEEREDEEDGEEGEDEEDEEEREDEEKDGDDDESEDGRWVTRDVNATSVDLSQLRGANATLLQQFDLPAGEYDTVHVEVGDIDATLTNGEDQRVKLPSDKLQLNSRFAVENGSEVDFVYDVSVHKAGNSGKYILKPVVGESGTDVPIERVDERDDDRGDGDDGRDGDSGDERSITASFVGDVSPGENVTVRVTEKGTAVANATVTVDGGPSGTTDADGEYVLGVPDDAEELEVEVASGDAEAELEREFDDDGGDGPGNGGNPGNGNGND